MTHLKALAASIGIFAGLLFQLAPLPAQSGAGSIQGMIQDATGQERRTNLELRLSKV